MKRTISIALTLIVLLQACVFVMPASAMELSLTEKTISDIISWQNETLGSVSDRAGENVCDWFIFSLGRSGYGDKDFAEAVEHYFTENRDSLSATDIERLTLACAANGGDVSSNGMLESALEGFEGDISEKLINQLIFTLHVLDCGSYSVPEGSGVTRTALIDEILSRQLDSGALYMMNKKTQETDITAMAAAALAPYINGDPQVRTSVEHMISYLSTQQNDDGTVSNWGAPSCETTAQTLIALCTLGIDPEADERFIKNGNTLLDGLMSYKQNDGGFLHNSDSTGSDAYATSQAFYSLVSYVRYKNGLRVLFDMRSEQSNDIRSLLSSVNSEITALVTDDTPNEALLSEIYDLPYSERLYVFTVSKATAELPSFSLDEIADDSGTEASRSIFLLYEGAQAQSLSAADDEFSRLETPSSLENTASQRSGTPAEIIVLISIALAAFIAIILNHTVWKRNTGS